ncbi:hypothetical protein LX90_007776 [Lentzea flava]|nr:hypothetical protein [Lentzea flava]
MCATFLPEQLERLPIAAQNRDRFRSIRPCPVRQGVVDKGPEARGIAVSRVVGRGWARPVERLRRMLYRFSMYSKITCDLALVDQVCRCNSSALTVPKNDSANRIVSALASWLADSRAPASSCPWSVRPLFSSSCSPFGNQPPPQEGCVRAAEAFGKVVHGCCARWVPGSASSVTGGDSYVGEGGRGRPGRYRNTRLRAFDVARAHHVTCDVAECTLLVIWVLHESGHRVAVDLRTSRNTFPSRAGHSYALRVSAVGRISPLRAGDEAVAIVSMPQCPGGCSRADRVWRVLGWLPKGPIPPRSTVCLVRGPLR